MFPRPVSMETHFSKIFLKGFLLCKVDAPDKPKARWADLVDDEPEEMVAPLHILDVVILREALNREYTAGWLAGWLAGCKPVRFVPQNINNKIRATEYKHKSRATEYKQSDSCNRKPL